MSHQQNQEKFELTNLTGRELPSERISSRPDVRATTENQEKCLKCELYHTCERGKWQTENQERDEWVEIVKSIMFADDVDWELSLQNEGITYLKSYQLHGKIKEVISNLLHKQRQELVERTRRFFEKSSDDWEVNSENWIKLDKFLNELKANPKGDE